MITRSDAEPRARAGGCARPMRFEGMEALELYLLELDHNLASLARQVALLQGALVKRGQLLCEIAADRRAQNAPQPLHLSETAD
ncbi:MAG TPA: hypothetical protein VKW08_25715 [Xanthobacteraceae bacterium]|nr:hypothetical protein [Xanthobacteraceae bacterium]